MNKKILYIVPGYDPTYNDGVGNRVNSFVSAFESHGYEVTVAPLVWVKSWYRVWRRKGELRKSCKWLILPFYFSYDNLKYNLFIPLFRVLFWLYALVYRPSFILTDYAMGAYLVGLCRNKTKIIVNHRGDYIDEYAFSNGDIVEEHTLANMLKLLSYSVTIAHGSICVSEKLKNNIEFRTNKKLQKCYIFPCCPDIERFAKVEPVVSEDTIVGYFGGLNKWQCFSQVIEIAQRLSAVDSSIKLLILTNSDASSYRKDLEKLGKGNYIIKSVPYKDMPNEIARMDVSFALREDRDLNFVSSPTKIGESLAAGVPVVVTEASGDYIEQVRHKVNGYVLKNFQYSDKTIKDLSDYIRHVKANRKEISTLCKSSVENRKWKIHVDAFISMIETIL